MSRSFKKRDFCGNTTASSEKQDKQFANRSLRRTTKTKLHIDPETETLPTIREISDIWNFNKDGKHYFGHIHNNNHISKVDWQIYYKKLKRK